MNSRLEEAEEQTSDLEAKVMESNEANKREKEELSNMRVDLGNSVIPLNIIILYYRSLRSRTERKGSRNFI